MKMRMYLHNSSKLTS